MPLRLMCLLAALLLLWAPSLGEDASPLLPDEGTPEVFPPAEYEWVKSRVAHHESDTLQYTIESFTLDSVHCYLTKIWVRDPERQFRKVNAPWREALSTPMALAKKVPEALLATNASGYISARYPTLPDGYPGTSPDYYFTTLGSLVITDGEILRNLEGVPFWGLALSEDGIVLYQGADNAEVLASSPCQTWAFFEPCAMQVGGEDTLPEAGTWSLADERHPRTILARVNRNNYLLLHVRRNDNSYGLSLHRLNIFFSRHFQTEWVYNLDGGPSSSLVFQKKNAGLTLLAPNYQQIADILCVTD